MIQLSSGIKIFTNDKIPILLPIPPNCKAFAKTNSKIDILSIFYKSMKIYTKHRLALYPGSSMPYYYPMNHSLVSQFGFSRKKIKQYII